MISVTRALMEVIAKPAMLSPQEMAQWLLQIEAWDSVGKLGTKEAKWIARQAKAWQLVELPVLNEFSTAPGGTSGTDRTHPVVAKFDRYGDLQVLDGQHRYAEAVDRGDHSIRAYIPSDQLGHLEQLIQETKPLTEAVSPYFLKLLNLKIRRGEADPLRESGRTETCVTATALVHGETAIFTFSLDHQDHIVVAVTAQRDGLAGKGLGTFAEIDEALAAAVAACKDLDRMWSKSVS